MGLRLRTARAIVNQSALSEEQQRVGMLVQAGALPPEAALSVGLSRRGDRLAPGSVFGETAVEESTLRPTRPERTRRGRRGGGRREEDPLKDLKKLREEIVERAKPELQKFTEAVAELDRVQALLGLTQQEYNHELDLLSQKYLEAGGAADFFAEQQRRLEDGFIAMIVQGENFRDVMISVAESIARAALESAFFGRGPMANLFGGGAGLLSLLGIPGFATGTKNAPGGLAVVGEQGKEIVNLPKGSEVIPADRTGMMLGGGSPQVDVSVTPKIVNVLDPALVGDYLNTPQGEELVMNIVSRNQPTE